MLTNIKKYFSRFFRRLYRQRRLRLVLDFSLIAVIFILAAAIFSLNFFRPQIDFFRPSPRLESEIIEPALESSFILENRNMQLPGRATLNIHLKNRGKDALTDLRLDFKTQAAGFSITKIEPAKTNPAKENTFSNFEIANSSVVVSSLEAAEEAEFALFIYFRSNGEGRLLTWRVDSQYKISNQLFKESLPLGEIKIAASLALETAAYYNSPQGDQLGSGPWPPVSGLPTNLWIFFRLQPADDFRNFSLSAKLSKNVTLTDDSALLAGDLRYNPAVRQVIWQVPEVEGNGQDYRAGFEVQLIPTETDLGKFAKILENIKFQATDIFTGLVVEGSAPLIDTGLEHDAFNRGEGRVLELE